MMSMSLAELGHVLCQEFDQREHELRTLQSEIRTRVKNDREELSEQRKVDHTNQLKAQKQIFEDASKLLDNYRVERADLAKVLKSNVESQIVEMMAWGKEHEEELLGWHNAGEYILSKRVEGARSEHKVGGYQLRKRTGR